MKSSGSYLVHCDGSRLVTAALGIEQKPSKIVSGADSVTFAVDKEYATPMGVVLAGSHQFIQRYVVQNGVPWRFYNAKCGFSNIEFLLEC